MDANFWHEKWERGEIAFHNSEAHPLLVRYFPELGLPQDARIFIPLCGKTRDIAWFLSQGCRAAGAELSRKAVDQLFEELQLIPAVKPLGNLFHYSAPGIDIFAGDILELTQELLGPVDAVYDRAALVALPEFLRERYTKHLSEISRRAPQLLICYDYPQKEMQGPPFSISDQEVKRHYESLYRLNLLAAEEVAGGLKGQCAAQEKVWRLSNRSFG